MLRKLTLDLSPLRMILGFMLVDTSAAIFGMPTALFPAIAEPCHHHASYLDNLFAAPFPALLRYRRGEPVTA